jgi:hypothetical protein
MDVAGCARLQAEPKGGPMRRKPLQPVPGNRGAQKGGPRPGAEISRAEGAQPGGCSLSSTKRATVPPPALGRNSHPSASAESRTLDINILEENP